MDPDIRSDQKNDDKRGVCQPSSNRTRIIRCKSAVQVVYSMQRPCPAAPCVEVRVLSLPGIVPGMIHYLPAARVAWYCRRCRSRHTFTPRINHDLLYQVDHLQ